MNTVPSSRITHFSAVFFASDRKAVLDYYRQLGFWCDEVMGFVERDGLHMIFHESEPAREIVPHARTHGPEALHVFAMVEGVDGLYEEFRSKGAVFQYELRTNEYRMREFAIRDPQGYTIGFGEPVA
ncbi:VOC family protein [Cohnella sp. REN36]|uniref:VOC family protein n=1 Tax=Cohnella sp. REN36 TaxID=2887347 RepID=UPI001D14097E|nr:VOC family protein [Cohnella sp. REN36]MCC3372557.1 VOC family protein [Cohnella sp. REN36]